MEKSTIKKKPLKVNQYWYVTEIESCVLCGHEKIRKYRVYKKPEHPVKWIDFACSEHFI